MLGPTLTRDTTANFSRVFDGWWTAAASGEGTVVPDGAVDLMWSPGCLPWIAGPDTRPRAAQFAAGSTLIGLRMKPGAAQLLLNDSVASATDRAVSLGELWSQAQVDGLAGELAAADGVKLCAASIAAAVASRLPADWLPDPAVVDAVRQIRCGVPLDQSLSDRQLRRRFTQAMGYGTTFYRRIARLDRFTDLLATESHRTNAELAAVAGYFDEAHLWRDATALTGCSPSDLRTDYASAAPFGHH